MSRIVRTRRVVALTAAYVIALQALLLPLTVAAANPLTAADCTLARPGHGPLTHQTGCPCAVGCLTHCCDGSLNVPVSPRAVPPTCISREVTHPYAFATVRRAADHRPQIPRAPPAA